MKILVATPLYPPDIGGPATYAKILAEEFPKRGVPVEVVSYGDVRHLPKGLAHAVYAWKLFRALYDTDILLALDPVSVGLPAAIVAFLRNKKFIVRIAGDYAWEQGRQRFGVKVNLDEFVMMPSNKFLASVGFLRAIQRFVASRAERVIVPSNYLKRIVSAWKVPPEKITVVYNAAENTPATLSREELRKKFSWEGPILLSAGRLVPWKGFTLLIDLMPEVVKHHPNSKLFIAGSGPLLNDLEKKIAEQGDRGAITLLGDVPQKELMEYIRAADCFVLNTGYEGLSHQLLEVLLLGTPIVTTKVGGNPELIEHNATGLLVEYNDSIGLTNAIHATLEHPERAQQMAEQGRNFVASFTIDRMITETLAVLNETQKIR